MVDTLVLGTSASRRKSSSLFLGTKIGNELMKREIGLYDAILDNNYIALFRMLKEGHDPNDYYTSLLSSAVKINCDIEIFELLIEYGANVDAVYWGDNPDQYEWYKTPLMEAAYYKRADVCKLLLKNGAEVNKICGHNGRTALDYAGLKSFNGKVKRIIKLYGGLKSL